MEFNNKCSRANKHDTKNMTEKYIKATFLNESKHRFICNVLKEQIETECYVSSSSKLSKYLPLENNNLLISENTGKKLRTQYTLEAVEYDNSWYYVNFNQVNRLYQNYLLTCKQISIDEINREKFVANKIKTDFWIDNIGCVEVKALLSTTGDICFPDTSANRIERQILYYIEVLKEGIAVTFAFVNMCDNLTGFRFDDKKKFIQEYFKEAVALGLKIKAYSIIYEENYFKIVENIKLEENIIKAVSS